MHSHQGKSNVTYTPEKTYNLTEYVLILTGIIARTKSLRMNMTVKSMSTRQSLKTITQTMTKITQDALSGERLSQSQVVSKRKYDWANKQCDSTKSSKECNQVGPR